MGPSKLRAIGEALKAEEDRFIGYAEIERRSKELGFGMTVRTLRFYVDEGILPPPKKVGKAPVYEEDWILNVVLGIHLMKTRLNRSLSEIRVILGCLQEDPAVLADKLSVLYEDTTKDPSLKPLERAGVADAFFGLLSGRLGGSPRQASEVRLSELVEVVRAAGRWEGDRWSPPSDGVILASQGLEVVEAGGEGVAFRGADRGGEAEEVEVLRAEARAEAEAARPVGAVSAEDARGWEELFFGRFEEHFERLGRVHCPLDGRAYKAGASERSKLKVDRTKTAIELMKRHRVYDRSLLDRLPLGEAREFQVFQRGLFRRGDLKVLVSARSAVPLGEFVRKGWAEGPLGVGAVDAALEATCGASRRGVFHYVGIYSPTGWTEAAKARRLDREDALVCLVERDEGGGWRRFFGEDPRWAGVERVFDPETDGEKSERVVEYMRERLRPKGEFVLLKAVAEDLDVLPDCVRAAVERLVGEDSELEVLTVESREILKRRRL